ncbi:MAG TPA: adenylate/guanylate cyclase domain-containing protein [Solirubrobacteraceae bacterium]|nr:adenylate/guanylate cyclase domain-containing protein [Solirubrobacteraceae bacterium]
MPDEPDNGRAGRRLTRARTVAASAASRLDQNPRLVTVAKLARELLPGDSRFGDPLSTAGTEQPHVVGRRLSSITAERPGVLREAGLSALQVWQALSESQGRGRGDQQCAILFTDLVGFSTWALEAGDTAALDLLRDVGQAQEIPVREHGGDVVKRLGDGMMAVFESPGDAVAALFEARRRIAEVSVPDYDPRVRAGLHVGRPRRLGGDYLGVDVNIAARVADEAGADELLVSDRALEMLDSESLSVRKKRFFRVKGVPKDVTTYSVRPRA